MAKDFPRSGGLQRIDWVVVGGESGPGCRPMGINWARILRDQCKLAGTSFYMKQWGGETDHRSQLSDLPKGLQIREWPKTNTESLNLRESERV